MYERKTVPGSGRGERPFPRYISTFCLQIAVTNWGYPKNIFILNWGREGWKLGGHITAGSNCRAGKRLSHPHPSLLCLCLSFPWAKALGPEWILTPMNQTRVWICSCYLSHSSFPKPKMTNTAKNFPLQNIYYTRSLSQGCSHYLLIQC